MARPRAETPPETGRPETGHPETGHPETNKIAEVTRLLAAAATFPVISAPAPPAPNHAVPLFPVLRDQLLVAIHVDDSLHRFDGHRMGHAAVAEIHGRLAPIPDDFVPGPGLVPPPTLLNPFRSQRLALLDGRLSFHDRRGSAVQIFGTGRSFPVTVDGRPALKIGAVIDVLSGAGDLAGLPGETFPGATLVIDGLLRPPDDLRLHMVLRVLDPAGHLAAREPLVPMEPSPALPDPGVVTLFLQGEVDPQRPVRLLAGPEGRPIGAQISESLRLVRFEDALETSALLHCRTEAGPIVGTRSALLYFDFQNSGAVIPAQTTGGVFSLHDPEGRSLGSLHANLVEGRAFRTVLPGVAMPVFRIGGFGPIKGGTGELAGVSGMVTLNAAMSMFPRTFSNLYVLRLDDPAGRLRVCLG
jgi:hypothetical protein